MLPLARTIELLLLEGVHLVFVCFYSAVNKEIIVKMQNIY